MVGEPSSFLTIDFKIKEYTVVDYIDNMLNRYILTGIFDYRFGKYFTSINPSKSCISDMRHNYNSLTKKLEKLCSYGLLLDMDRKQPIHKEELKPVEFYIPIILANDFIGACDYRDTCE